MERLLIVNADDFGLSKGQNYGIIEACRNGIVTSTTALVNGQAIDHAVQLSRDEPSLAIAVSICVSLSYLDANLRILIAIIMCICSRRFSRLLPGLRLKRGLRCASTVSRYLTLVIYRLICAVRRDSVARFMVKRLARHCSCKCWMTQAIGVILRWR